MKNDRPQLGSSEDLRLRLAVERFHICDISVVVSCAVPGTSVHLVTAQRGALEAPMFEFSITQGPDGWTIAAHVSQTSQDGLALAADVARHLRSIAAALDAFVAAETPAPPA